MEYGENVTHQEIIEVVLVHCNTANTDYQQDSRALCTFVPSISFVSLLENLSHLFKNIKFRMSSR